MHGQRVLTTEANVFLQDYFTRMGFVGPHILTYAVVL